MLNVSPVVLVLNMHVAVKPVHLAYQGCAKLPRRGALTVWSTGLLRPWALCAPVHHLGYMVRMASCTGVDETVMGVSVAHWWAWGYKHSLTGLKSVLNASFYISIAHDMSHALYPGRDMWHRQGALHLGSNGHWSLATSTIGLLHLGSNGHWSDLVSSCSRNLTWIEQADQALEWMNEYDGLSTFCDPAAAAAVSQSHSLIAKVDIAHIHSLCLHCILILTLQPWPCQLLHWPLI